MWKALLPALALVALPAAAQMYKWVDEKGVTHYSEKPPADGRGKALDIKTQDPRPAAPKPSPKAADAKAAPGKAATPREQELAMLAGDWSTPAGRSPPFSITFQPFGGDVMTQYALKGSGKSWVASGTYELTGGGGKGSLKTDLSDSSRALNYTSERIDYSIKGAEMEVVLRSGEMAGSYRVIRSAR